jgi:Domain of unknown function (DUF5671)
MQTARRIYLYLMSAVGLGMASFGLWQLLTLAFERVSRQLGGSLIDTISEADTRSQLSLALALVAVAGPLWAIHWGLIGRGVRSATIGEPERAAPLRAFHVAIVELVALGVALVNGSTVVTSLIRGVIGRPSPYDGGAEGALAAVLIGGAVWAFHAWVRRGDERAGPLSASAAWWPRLSWYILMAAGVVMLCFGVAQLLQALLDLAVGRSIVDGSILNGEAEWWVDPVVGGMGSILIGGGTWLGPWLGLDRRLRSSDWTGPSERTSAVRKAFLTGALVFGAAATLFGAVTGLSAALSWLLGAGPSTDPAVAVQDAVGPSISFLAFTCVWWWSRRQSLAEGAGAWPEGGVAATRRLAGYAAAAVGLGFAGVGAGWLIGLVLDVALGGQRTVIAGADVWRQELATYVADLVVGTPLWLWHWTVATRRRVADSGVEATAPARRVYLYLVLAATLISSVSGLALIAYRLFGIVLGATSPPNIVSELSTPVGAVFVGALIVGYHAVVMRADQTVRLTPAALAAVAPIVPTPEGPAVEVPLIVVGPPGTDPGTVLATLRAALPPGFAIRRPGPEADGPSG